MKLFSKGKGEAGGTARQAPTFQPIDRGGLLGLLDQVVNGGQSGVLDLHEPRGSWTYAFQGGALTHASGGRVRGARQAFDLLWEFQSGEFQFTPGPNTALAGNLYIDKNRLQDLLRRSQAVLQSPVSPYISPDQQRPIAPVQRPYSAPAPGQIPTWQPPQQGQPQPPQPLWQPQAQPGQPQQQPAWQPQAQPGQPAWGNGGYPPPPPGYQQPYPQPPYGQQGPVGPPQGYPQQPYPAAPQPPVFPGPFPTQQMTAPAPAPVRPAPAPAAAAPAPAAPAPAPTRQATPPSFSVPPMAVPKRKQPTYQPPVALASAVPPVPEVMKPAAPSQAKDDLQSLRASLVSQAPAAPTAPSAPSWGVRSPEGTVTAAPAPTRGKKGKGDAKAAKSSVPGQKKAKSKLRAEVDVRLIKFLLWACERKYSADDHWSLQDAFEVSTMELRDQFIGAFSESFKSGPKKTIMDDDVDQMAAGRMRGRAKKR